MRDYTMDIIIGYMPIIIMFLIVLIIKLRMKRNKQNFSKVVAVVPYIPNNEYKEQPKNYNNYHFHIYENRYDKKHSNDSSGYKKYNHKNYDDDIIDAEIIE